MFLPEFVPDLAHRTLEHEVVLMLLHWVEVRILQNGQRIAGCTGLKRWQSCILSATKRSPCKLEAHVALLEDRE
jgi:hypothetical protein